ncbi:MAG: hypothetical protein M3285_08665 [Actinomycetota bacterium]|nr:hypothetical protein [Actinomycetota bacterium]
MTTVLRALGDRLGRGVDFEEGAEVSEHAAVTTIRKINDAYSRRRFTRQE